MQGYERLLKDVFYLKIFTFIKFIGLKQYIIFSPYFAYVVENSARSQRFEALARED